MAHRLDSYINGIENLPTPPVLMIKLMAAFRKPEPDVDEVANLLSHDPSLTAEVLRSCNSASFAGDEVTVDIFEAIMRLGFYRIYQITMAKAGMAMLSSEKPIGAVTADELWRHSAATAVLSGMLAKATGEAEGIAYTSGLLHDIGKLVLACAEGAKYELLMRESGTYGSRLDKAEKLQFGFGHGAVGARLLERWSVPIEVAHPIGNHHEIVWPEPYARLSAIISLANILAHELELKTTGTAENPEATVALTALSISQEETAQLLEKAKSEIEALTSAIESR